MPEDRHPDCGCITAYDLGVGPELAPPDLIAHVHPECPVHQELNRA